MLQLLRKRVDEDEQGFTLIELLVVVIIIGILAAIAIPVFLNQRERAWRSAVQSDLRNAAVSMETYYTDEGDYDIDSVDDLSDFGYSETDGVVLEVTTDDQQYCLAGGHTNNEEEIWYLGSGGSLDDDADVGCPNIENPTDPTFPE